MAIVPGHRKFPILLALAVAGAIVVACLAILLLRGQALPPWLGGAGPAVVAPVPDKTPIPGEQLPLGAPCFGEHALANRDYTAAYQSFLSRAGRDAGAEFQLGVMFRDGLGVLRNPQMAIERFTRAAAMGDRQAMTALGWMLAGDPDTGTNYPEAFRWYEKAARAGDRVAQFQLAEMYRHGSGTGKDMVAAYAWLSLLGDESVAAGQALPAAGALPVIAARDSLYKELSREQLAQADKQTREIRKTVAASVAPATTQSEAMPSCEP